MIIGVVRESKPGETRVAATPTTVGQLLKLGYEVVVESGAGDRSDFPDQSFDTIIGRGILHHLDFERAVREAARVLKPGGRLLCAEPLGDNPGAKLIRLLNPRSRTVDETPLTRQRIRFADNYFGGEHDHWFANLTSVPVGMLTSLLPLKADNLALRACDRIDAALMHTPLRTWMRYSVLNWQKR